jgi:hypothetical protein
MYPIKYQFNRIQLIVPFLGILPFLMLSLTEIKDANHEHDNNMLVIYIMTDMLLFFMLSFFISFVIIPAFKRGAALEIDDDKLHYFMFNKTIYWKNVESLSTCNQAIVVKSTDGSKAKIRTAWLKGNKQAIYDEIAAHVESNR